MLSINPQPTDGIAAMGDDLPWAAPAREQMQERAAFQTDPDIGDHALRGQLALPALTTFVMAGKATITIVSKKTGTRYTLKFSRPKDEAGRARPTWVSLLSGSDNEGDYTFLGTVWQDANGLTYRHSAKSRVGATTDSVRAVQWLLKCVNLGAEDKFAQCEVWHEGRCGRCGRKLTVPSSIESGFGPECITLVHGG